MKKFLDQPHFDLAPVLEAQMIEAAFLHGYRNPQIDLSNQEHLSDFKMDMHKQMRGTIMYLVNTETKEYKAVLESTNNVMATQWKPVLSENDMAAKVDRRVKKLQDSLNEKLENLLTPKVKQAFASGQSSSKERAEISSTEKNERFESMKQSIHKEKYSHLPYGTPGLNYGNLELQDKIGKLLLAPIIVPFITAGKLIDDLSEIVKNFKDGRKQHKELTQKTLANVLAKKSLFNNIEPKVANEVAQMYVQGKNVEEFKVIRSKWDDQATERSIDPPKIKMR